MLFAVANILLAFSLLICLFAALKGGVAERIGAAVILANLVAATANYALLKSQLIDLGIDGLTAVVMLSMTMRYASVWLGAVMLVYALQFGLDAFYLVMERSVSDMPHAIINNSNTIAIMIALGAGTMTAWRRRRHVEAAPPAFAEAAP